MIASDCSNQESSGREQQRTGILMRSDPPGSGHCSHNTRGFRAMSSTETRGSIILGVCKQDPERWREFDTIYRPILTAYLSNRGLRDFDLSDVIQDVYVKLLKNIHSYDRNKCRFRTWLFTVAQNTLIDHARRRASYKRALDGWAAQILRATSSDSLALEEEWRQLHREKVLAHVLRLVRSRVSSSVWACFEQRLLCNRPAQEIAAELKIEPGTIYVNACRVMKKVRALCEEYDEDLGRGLRSGQD